MRSCVQVLALIALAIPAALAASGTCTCSSAPAICLAFETACKAYTVIDGVSVTSVPNCGAKTCTISGSGSCPSGDVLTVFQAACTATCFANAAGTGTWTCSDSSSVCFPAHATVELSNGTVIRMDEIQVGDKVLVNAEKEYSDVFMFTHRLSAVNAEFVSLQTENGNNIMLTKNHYLYVNGKMAVSGIVKVGDKLQTKDGKSTAVTSVSTVRADGLYNPNTLHGDIVVNGIVASAYTSDINPTLAHAALMPVRMAYKLGGDVVGHAFDNGSDLIASILPDGKKQY